jgi:hypothetical protein
MPVLAAFDKKLIISRAVPSRQGKNGGSNFQCAKVFLFFYWFFFTQSPVELMDAVPP